MPETVPPATLAKTLLMDADKLSHDVRALIAPWRERLDIIATNIDAFLLEREL